VDIGSSQTREFPSFVQISNVARADATVRSAPQKPELMVSQMVRLFAEVQIASLQRKSKNQFTKWRVERRSALRQFMKVIGGDRPLQRLTRSDARAYRSYLVRRTSRGAIEVNTANKYLGRIAAMYRAIGEFRQLDLPDIFDRINIPGGGSPKARVAFDAEFVRTTMFRSGALSTLNDEARGIFYVVAETGMRPSEVCGLTKAAIRLDHDIPHLQVRPYGRDIKTDQSARDIPLVGAALEAMKRFPEGFPHYRDGAAKLSAVVNKYLRTHGFLVEKGQSFYSLRHLFEDRLTAVEAPEKVIASLMGHKWQRPRYGKGPSLEQKRCWLLRIAFVYFSDRVESSLVDPSA
jgi:integrase